MTDPEAVRRITQEMRDYWSRVPSTLPAHHAMLMFRDDVELLLAVADDWLDRLASE